MLFDAGETWKFINEGKIYSVWRIERVSETSVWARCLADRFGERVGETTSISIRTTPGWVRVK
jgi:hypothetical protein